MTYNVFSGTLNPTQSIHRRPLEAHCLPWTQWCNNATTLTGYAIMTLMMMIEIGSVLMLKFQKVNVVTQLR